MSLRRARAGLLPAGKVRLALLALTVAVPAGLQAGIRHAQGTPEGVARAVVLALDAGDRAALERLAMTEREFRKVVWPRLPASRKERNLPVEYVWGDLAGKSEAHLTALLAGWERGGREVVRVDFAGGTTDYGRFRVHRRAVVTLRDPAGLETAARIFGSLLEKDGRFKVFSYVID